MHKYWQNKSWKNNQHVCLFHHGRAQKQARILKTISSKDKQRFWTVKIYALCIYLILSKLWKYLPQSLNTTWTVQDAVRLEEYFKHSIYWGAFHFQDYHHPILQTSIQRKRSTGTPSTSTTPLPHILNLEVEIQETSIAKEKKAFKGWIDPMATPYQYKKGWNPRKHKVCHSGSSCRER